MERVFDRPNTYFTERLATQPSVKALAASVNAHLF